MMILSSIEMPSFFTSPYFVPEPDNWHLKPDAPEDLKAEFAEWQKRQQKLYEEDTLD